MAAKKFVYDDTNKWSTKKLEALMKYIDETGIIPQDNPFFDKKIKLRKANVDFEYSREELLEMVKIKENILHFSETHAKVQTDYGQKLIRLRPYQKKVLLQFKKFRFNVYLASRQIGKCITAETLVYIDIPDKGHLTMPIFEAYYMMKQKMGIIDNILLLLYRCNYKLYTYREKLVM